MTQTIDDIKQLIDRFRQAEAGQANARKRAAWGDWPRGLGGCRPFPITIEPEAPMWGDILGFTMDRYFTDPEEYLRRQLEMSLWRFERWDEDTPLEKRIRIWMGTSLEASLFGGQTRYPEDDCPWLVGPHVVQGPEDFEKLTVPDFHRSGLMPRAHEFYERIREILPEDFAVDFPDWERSPFGVCVHLRGTEDFLVDLVQDAGFAHRQLRFITDCRKQFVRDRADFLGRDLEPGVLLNDEVNGELFGPDLYARFALPLEVQLGRFQGIKYWHSCGKATDFMEMIRTIEGLEVFHVGPRTDVARAAEVMRGLALQVCLEPSPDVQRADEDHIRRRIRGIAEACKDTPFTIRADGLHTMTTLDRELPAIDRWLGIAKDVRNELA
jgi:hypothetical protein